MSAATKRFCEPVLRSRVLLVFATIYTNLSYIAVLVRPGSALNLLKLYDFSESFRVQFALLAAAGLLAYLLVVQCTLTLIDRRQQRRLQPE